ncbi:MAG TPA: type II secretion system F family protein [Phycisphaeraceae bacterium]
MLWRLTISVMIFVAVNLLVRHGYGLMVSWLKRQEEDYQRALRQRLMIDMEPRTALVLALGGAILVGAFIGVLSGSAMLGVIAAVISGLMPALVIQHLEAKRRQTLDRQLVDALVTLASGVRAGLNLVQAMDWLVQHHQGPVRQEFAHLLREYQLGLDLDQAMRNAANRIGSPLYRLAFTAMQVHRLRGGNTAESLDRIADSIREIHRLEGKLDALTAQGRFQARMMAAMPLVFLAVLWGIDRQGVALLLTEPAGRLILLGVAALIVAAFLWIRRIMAVDL